MMKRAYLKSPGIEEANIKVGDEEIVVRIYCINIYFSYFSAKTKNR